MEVNPGMVRLFYSSITVRAISTMRWKVSRATSLFNGAIGGGQIRPNHLATLRAVISGKWNSESVGRRGKHKPAIKKLSIAQRLKQHGQLQRLIQQLAIF